MPEAIYIPPFARSPLRPRSHPLSLFNELKRRKVFRVGIAYVIAAWLVVQAADLVADNFLAPVWVMQMIISLLIVGLPISLILSWAFDLTVDGIKRTEYGEIEGSLTVSNKSILALVGGLFVAVAVIFYVAWPRDDRSIAVLPFEDISPGGDQAYFGNGIADELRLELQRLDGLRVAGRTSSIASAQEDSKTIGEILNVDSILEGSIRKEGNSVRITVQLTNVADGFTIWSESYNRKLENIFEMQEEIATSVAGALGVRLGVGGVNAFKGAGTQNVEAYEAYLQGMGQPFAQATVSFERATQLDPNYAAAWAQLGLSTGSLHWRALPEDAPAIFERNHPFIVRAVELDPESAVANTLLANSLYFFRRDWIGADKAYAKALLLLTDRYNLNHRANMLMRAGRSAMARQLYDKAESLEPLGGWPACFREYVSLAQLNFTEAKEIAEWYRGDSLMMNFGIEIALNEGDPEKIKTAIRSLPKTKLSTDALYYPVLSVFDTPEMVLSVLRAIYADEGTQWPSKLHDIALLAAYFDDPQFALQVKAEEVRNTPARQGALWYPVMSEVRQLPEFKELVTDINLVAYWRASGWADLCRPLGDDDFECI
ncbi:MAG: hypothetical protein IIB68_12835 [Proteobacteria bacterium]|nr:hypothetical protein [Pseudomonadota bacterium]